MAVAGLGVGASFAAFPALVIPAVPPSETGSAMSIDQVLRYVGFALGSALTATVLAAATPSGAAAPAAGGYTVLAVVGVAVCATTATVAWRAVRRSSPDGPAAGFRAARQSPFSPLISRAQRRTRTCTDVRSAQPCHGVLPRPHVGPGGAPP